MKLRAARTLRRLALLIAGITLGLWPLVPAPHAHADFLPGRFDQMTDSHAGVSATHLFGFNYSDTTNAVGSVQFQFCSNTPIPEDPCTVPAGLDLTASTLASQTGNIGYSIHPASTANNLILTRFPTVPLGGPSTYEIANVVNPSSNGSYYVRIRTFGSTDATGPFLEEAGVVFAIVGDVTINTEVPPYLIFCAAVTIAAYDCSSATSFFIDMGEFSKTQANAATSEFVVATNAGFGYTVTIDGTTMTSGINTIPALNAQAPSVPGTGQFGVNLRANTSPASGADVSGPGVNGAATVGYGTPNLFQFNAGDNIVTSPGSSDFEKFTTTYVTNIDPAQPIGFYATTISYICLANF